MLAQEHPVTLVRAPNGLKLLASYHQHKRTWQTHVVFLVGSTGTGKSTLAKTLWPSAFWWSQLTSSHATLWADGYAGEEIVVCDDWDLTKVSREVFLMLANHTPCQLQTKGGTVQFSAKLLVFTSNVHPSNVWYNDAATSRRICTVVEPQTPSVTPTTFTPEGEIQQCSLILTPGQGSHCTCDHLPEAVGYSRQPFANTLTYLKQLQ